MVQTCSQVADHLDATLVNMRFVKPLDEELLAQLADQHELLVTVEENAVAGGAGSGVNECIAALGKRPGLLNLGLTDNYHEHASRDEILADAGLDEATIERKVRERMTQDGLGADRRSASA